MNSGIDKFYHSENLSSDSRLSFWQHKCGLFQWHISGDNVSLSCADPKLEKITWPNLYREKKTGGP